MGGKTHFDLIVVGTGFASTFFIEEYCARRPAARVLVIERGLRRTHGWQLDHPSQLRREAEAAIRRSGMPDKSWRFAMAFGGGSNCWWACTPRMLPSDFELRSRYGVGRDWPLRYDDLEPFYVHAERKMSCSGPSDDSPFPRSAPYPEPPHRMSEPDKVLKRALPGAFFVQPCARPVPSTRSGRPPCCGNGVCALCPINSKFTIQSSMGRVFESPNVTLVLGATALAIGVASDRAQEVVYESDGKERIAGGDLVVLGANAAFNAHLLLASGLDHAELGRGLVEQASRDIIVDLDGLEAQQGSTSITGHAYPAYDGEHRRHRAAALVEVWNVPMPRLDRGRHRQRVKLKMLVEDLRQTENRVVADEADRARPRLHFEHRSDYATRTLNDAEGVVKPLLDALPVEKVSVLPVQSTEAHIIGTTVMGDNPDQSIIDRHLVHHRIRNLVLVGAGAFPTAAPANPTLTLCALSTWAASALLGSSSTPVPLPTTGNVH